VRRGRPRGRGRRTVVLTALLVCAGPLLSGCGLLGGPQPLSADAPLKMTITIPALTGNVLPARFTCYGHAAAESPPIFWSGAPQGTKSLALVVDDSATPIEPRVYWIVFDIGPDTTDLPVGTLPLHARVAQNSSHRAAYDPPCPVGAPHKYRFTIYAVNTSFGRSLPNGATLLQAWTTIAAHVIARGTTTATACPPAGRQQASGSTCSAS
jgi:Raf kinase inhibitor-like YbhB/YbcL family protein